MTPSLGYHMQKDMKKTNIHGTTWIPSPPPVVTLQAGLDKDVCIDQTEDAGHAKHFAQVSVMEFQPGGEGHPQELHRPALLVRQALVPETGGETLAADAGQTLGLLPGLPQLVPQLQGVCAASHAGGQVSEACHHLDPQRGVSHDHNTVKNNLNTTSTQ